MNPLNRLFLGAYGGLWRAAMPFLRRNRRLKEGFADRLVPQGWPEADWGAEESHVWIQAASGGEAWLAHALVSALPAELPGAGFPRILCTTCTRQGLDVLEKLDGATARYLPLDRPGLMRKAMDAVSPRAVALLETELWPGLLAAAREKGVPVLVLNGRMTEKSLSAYRLTASFWRSLAPRVVLAISEDDAERFSRLFGSASRVAVMPNIKFDRVAGPAMEAGQISRAAVGCPETSLLAVFASVREEEEDLLLPVLAGLCGLNVGGAPVAVAVAPRHMHRIDAWKDKLRRADIPCALRSAGPGSAASGPMPGARPVYLWDTFGELQALYGIADVVFVGGSLAPLGGQNFLEPLAQGVRPLVGPHIRNFLWVGEGIFASGLAGKVAAPEALPGVFEHALRERRAALPAAGGDAVWREARRRAGAEVRERFAAWLAPHTGGSAIAAAALAEYASGGQRGPRAQASV